MPARSVAAMSPSTQGASSALTCSHESLIRLVLQRPRDPAGSLPRDASPPLVATSCS